MRAIPRRTTEDRRSTRGRRASGFAAIAGVLALAGCGGSDTSTTGASATSTSPAHAAPRLGPALEDMDSLPGVLTTSPPWPANGAKLQLRLREIGLDPLVGVDASFYVQKLHLDVYVDGKEVRIPDRIGIGPRDAYFSELHNHDDTGEIDIESPRPGPFTLGQFFAVWGVRLSDTCIGNRCENGDRQLRAWVNGEPVNADPTRIVLQHHQQIVLAYGAPDEVPEPVPAMYDFAAAGR